MQSPRVRVERRIQETDRFLPGSETQLVDAGDDATPDRSARAGAADEGGRALVEDDDVVADGGDVRVCAAVAVVDAAILAEAVVVDGAV